MFKIATIHLMRKIIAFTQNIIKLARVFTIHYTTRQGYTKPNVTKSIQELQGAIAHRCSK